MTARKPDADLVLIGGGHSHVQVLRRLIMQPVEGVRTTLVVDRPMAVYSGMVPGVVAGQYATCEVEIDVVPLARLAGARIVLGSVEEVDARANRVLVEGRPPILYDVASINVGSSIRGLDLPGVLEHALCTRPIGQFVQALEERLSRLEPGKTIRVAVVGGGTAGVELAFTLRARLIALGLAPEMVLVSDGPALLPKSPARVVDRLEALAAEARIEIRKQCRASAVDEEGVSTNEGHVRADLVVWATGAAPQAMLSRGGLPLTGDGFVRVDERLRVIGRENLFAVGDCAKQDVHEWVPRAGVYAVRQGPVLDRNLRASLHGKRLRAYVPQRDFLSLVNLGEGRALAAKWGIVAEGRFPMRVKDWIDRRFMDRFRVLDADGAMRRELERMASMDGDDEMRCGGCAAKLESRALDAALRRLPAAPPDPAIHTGLDRRDDVAAIRRPDGSLELQTVDAFRPFLDDPYLLGRIAAVNAVSDVLAKGGRPRQCMALVTLDDERPAPGEEQLFQILSGIRAVLDELDCSLVGGHTTVGEELFVGLAVVGEAEAPERMLGLDGARPGDRLILTKPLGTGVLLAAHMRAELRGSHLPAAIASMTRLNARAARLAIEHGAHACTDVTGFGLAGHLAAMLDGSGVDARLVVEAPALPGAREALARGLRSTAHPANLASFGGRLEGFVAGGAEEALLLDPQTSGGLLIAAPQGVSEALVEALVAAGESRAESIGVIIEAEAAPGRIRADHRCRGGADGLPGKSTAPA